uniref:CCHC-type domain-containing protein n=1 Tax=Caenorhabditis japonica TaxID=281687 RepID=A0A8R1EVK4_CAEJA
MLVYIPSSIGRRFWSRRDQTRSGQEPRPEKKKCSGASKWDKNSAKWDEKVAKWPNGAWLERGDRKTRCSEQDGETKSGSRSSTSQKTTAETIKEVVESMNKMMRVAALPEPKMFDGSGSFGEFKRTFLMKFREVVKDDEDLVAILEENFLVGTSKSLFRSLENRRKRPITVLFEEIEEKLKRRQGDSQTHALAVFEELSRGAGQKMWEYLVEVEKWSRKGYPQADRTTISQMRVTKLMKAAKEDRNLHNLLIMKRRETPVDEQYDTLKDIVLQQETERKKERSYRAEATDGNSRTESRWNGSETWEKRAKEEQLSDGEASQKNVDQKGRIKCYNCGGVGHIVKQCTSKLVANVVREGQLKGTRSAIVKMWENCEILGQKRKVTIDSGAVVSVISSRAWEKLKSCCVDWKERCEVLAKPHFKLVNASRLTMPVQEQVTLSFKIEKVRPHAFLAIFHRVTKKT